MQNQTIYISSDSQAALRAVASPRVKQLLVGNCIDNLNMLSQNNQVQLMWVPGHSDIEGNEQADILAKMVLTQCVKYLNLQFLYLITDADWR